MLQMSDLKEYLLFYKAYGLMYIGVPTLWYKLQSGAFISLQNPKSANLGIPSEIKMFSGLISLWMILFLTNYLYPFRMCLKIFID